MRERGSSALLALSVEWAARPEGAFLVLTSLGLNAPSAPNLPCPVLAGHRAGAGWGLAASMKSQIRARPGKGSGKSCAGLRRTPARGDLLLREPLVSPRCVVGHSPSLAATERRGLENPAKTDQVERP